MPFGEHPSNHRFEGGQTVVDRGRDHGAIDERVAVSDPIPRGPNEWPISAEGTGPHVDRDVGNRLDCRCQAQTHRIGDRLIIQVAPCLMVSQYLEVTRCIGEEFPVAASHSGIAWSATSSRRWLRSPESGTTSTRSPKTSDRLRSSRARSRREAPWWAVTSRSTSESGPSSPRATLPKMRSLEKPASRAIRRISARLPATKRPLSDVGWNLKSRATSG